MICQCQHTELDNALTYIFCVSRLRNPRTQSHPAFVKLRDPIQKHTRARTRNEMSSAWTMRARSTYVRVCTTQYSNNESCPVTDQRSYPCAPIRVNPMFIRANLDVPRTARWNLYGNVLRWPLHIVLYGVERIWGESASETAKWNSDTIRSECFELCICVCLNRMQTNETPNYNNITLLFYCKLYHSNRM